MESDDNESDNLSATVIAGEHEAQGRPSDLIYFPIICGCGALLALAMPQMCLLHAVFSLLVGMIFHELGHAVMFWLFGIPAVPTWFLAVNFTNELSVWFFVCFLGVLLLVVWQARRAGYPFFYYGGMVLIALLFFCSFILAPLAPRDALTIFAGQGGELVLTTVVLCAFFARLPKYFNWHISRYVVCFLAATLFWQKSFLWLRAVKDQTVLPLGASLDFGLINGGQSSGDLDRLIRDFHWSVNEIIGNYLAIAVVCLFVQIAVYTVHKK